MGSAMAGAVGATSAGAGSMFAALGTVIASWALANIQVNPTAMVAASGVVSGAGTFAVTGSADDLGTLLAAAMTIPPTATASLATWKAVAGGIVDHFNGFAVVNGTGFSAGVPLTGFGTFVWTSPVFVPPLAARLGTTDPVAALALTAFETMLLAFIMTNALVAPVSLSGPPLSAPPDGPVAGTGTIV